VVKFSDDLDVLSRTLYGESDPNNLKDAEAIASVIVNRKKLRNWPNSIARVCLQPWQFSCWNQNDPMRERIIGVTTNDAWFRECIDIAQRAVIDDLADPTHRSTHYYATYIAKPKWAKSKKPVYAVTHRKGSQHLFFNNIDTPPPQTPREALDQQRPLSSTGTVKAAAAGGVASAGVAGAIAEQADQLTPAVGLIGTIATWGPWAIVAVLLVAIGIMLWRRYDDRRQGLR